MAKRRDVYKFTEMAELRFKPESLNKTPAIIKLEEVKGWTQKLIQLAGQKIFRSKSPEVLMPSTPRASRGPVVDLTLAAYLNPELLIIGNSSKLDLIQIDINKEESEVEVKLLS